MSIEVPFTDGERKRLRRAFSTVRRNGKRPFRDNRHWYSPPHIVHDLDALENIPRDVKLWECMQGDGRLVRELKKLGYDAVGSDDTEGHNFLTMTIEEMRKIVGADQFNILTNPDFKIATEAVLRAFEVADSWIAMLVPLKYIAAQKRTRLFESPPGGWSFAALYPYAMKPKFTRPDGTVKAMSRSYWADFEVAWLVWEKTQSAVPLIRFQRIQQPTAKG